VLSINETASGVTLTIKVQPRARKNALLGELGGVLKIAVTAPPVDGRANDACITLLAAALKVPRSAITITSGQSGRLKVVHARGISVEEFRKRLGP
jgi:uncharacterized protein (TIGR00251 family)